MGESPTFNSAICCHDTRESCLAVIPARGGSKGIPRKNMRLMHGRPLIEYSIENALACRYIDTVVVSSDSDEILSFAEQFDQVECLDRSSELSKDAVTLDPVVYDAVTRMEQKLGRSFDTVVTLQPTSPLLSCETLEAALKRFTEEEWDSMISVVNSPHLSWTKDETGTIVPEYTVRLNRQQLPPRYLETGAFFISKRAYITPTSRLGEKISVFEVPSKESIDIDDREDWTACEAVLARKKIAFRADGHKELGLGHVYRALTIAYTLIEHDVIFLTDASSHEGVERLRASNMPVVELNSEKEFFAWLKENRPDVLVNDTLDTSAQYVQHCKKYAERVVTFEDLGPGARFADAVVNAIYEGAPKHSNTYVGKRYVCLRDEFLISRPASFFEEVRRILVTFGGTDPLDLTSRIFRLAREMNANGVKIVFDFVIGPGYSGSVYKGDPSHGIEVSRGVARVSDHMRSADLAICSQGRTTFELATMGVPAIVLAQNERERLHTFAQMDNGFINLGLGNEVSDEDISATVYWLVSAGSIRREMRRLMLANDLKGGISRVKMILLGE